MMYVIDRVIVQIVAGNKSTVKRGRIRKSTTKAKPTNQTAARVGPQQPIVGQQSFVTFATQPPLIIQLPAAISHNAMQPVNFCVPSAMMGPVVLVHSQPAPVGNLPTSQNVRTPKSAESSNNDEETWNDGAPPLDDTSSSPPRRDTSPANENAAIVATSSSMAVSVTRPSDVSCDDDSRTSSDPPLQSRYDTSSLCPCVPLWVSYG